MATNQEILARLFSTSNSAILERTEEVTVAYGKVNLSNMYASYATMAVEAPFIRKSAADTGQRVSGSRHASQVSNWAENGVIVSEKVRHTPNTVVLLQSSWKVRGSNYRDAGIFIRLRAAASLLCVEAMMPTGNDNVLGDRFTMFAGRGDIMDAEELKVLGIEVPHRWQVAYMNPTELEECFIVRELIPGVTPKPTIARVASADGVKLVEVPVQAKRRMRLRRS